MTNGNSGLVGIAADLIGGVKENLLGAEGVLSDVNMLGMRRPLTQINIAETLRAQGGILPSLQTGLKKMTAARKAAGTGAPPRRYRTPPTPPTDQAFEGTPIPPDEEVVFI